MKPYFHWQNTNILTYLPLGWTWRLYWIVVGEERSWLGGGSFLQGLYRILRLGLV